MAKGSKAGEKRKRRYYPRVRTDMLDFYGVNNLTEVNRTRRIHGLPEVKPKERECLRCDKKFLSENGGHRMCSHCRNVVKDYVNDIP